MPTLLEPIIRTISSLIDFFEGGKIEKIIARVNLNKRKI
jgi:hypothetical protein